MSKKVKKDFGTAINKWVDGIKKFEKDINFKELSRLSGKNIIRKMSDVKKPAEFKHIDSRYKTYDLWFYYDNPNKYYSNLFSLIYAIRPILHDDSNVSYRTISFQFPNDNSIHVMPLIHFVFNMIMWLPLFALDVPIQKDSIFMPRTFNNKSYVNYINNKIIEPYKHLTTHNQMSALLARMYDLFIIISERYSLDLGLSFSLNDLLTKWNTDQEIYDINHTKIPKNYSTSEAEDYINEKARRYSTIMLDDPNDNVLKPLIRSGQGVNGKQLREFTVSTGFKPTIDGYTYNILPKKNSNFIADGVRDPVDFTVDATGGRKAGILSLQIDDSGYLARAFGTLTSNIYLNNDPEYDCGSVNYYSRTIENKYDLEDMRGRWYLTKENTLRQLIDTDYELIGKTLKFRSPATCASKNGICATCYGYLYTQNLRINAGINSALKQSERTYQNTMSAKHILDTCTASLKMTDDFYDYFTIVQGHRILLREDIEMPENFELRINKNEIKLDQNIDDLKKNESVKGFILYNKETEESVRIDDVGHKNDLYFGDYLFNMIVSKRRAKKYDKDGWITFGLDEFDPEEDLFFVMLRNDELNRPLKEMKACIEKGKEIEGVETISELITKIGSLMKSGGVKTESVHIEILVRNMIRDKNNPIELPDYSKENPEYTITSIHQAILNSSSIITSLTFERIKEQLKNPLTYKKQGVSQLDRFFLLD